MNVVVVGSTGNLGHELVRSFSQAGHNVFGLSGEAVDMTKPELVCQAIQKEGTDLIINAVAYNDVDGAEKIDNRVLATTLNVQLPTALAQLSHSLDIPFVHYSTDYVFDGTKKDGYLEDDIPNPISFYGQTKYQGEKAVVAASGQFYIIRLSKIFGPAGTSSKSKPSFVSRMIDLAKTEHELEIVDAEVGCPTSTQDIAEATVALIEKKFPFGMYHFVNEGAGVTWFSFAQEIFAAAGVRVVCKPVSSSRFPTLARRPEYAMLLNKKFPPFRERQAALKEFFDAGQKLR